MDFSIFAAKRKALISCVVAAQLFCAFVFAYAKSRFYHDSAHFFNHIRKVAIENDNAINERGSLIRKIIFDCKSAFVDCLERF